MKEVKQIKTGQLNPDGDDAVFIAFAGKVALGNRYGHKAGKEVCAVLMQLRWSGDFGFPGGKVDDGENLEQALRREVKEETGFVLDPDEELNLLCSHQVIVEGKPLLNTHLFIRPSDLSELKALTISAAQAPDFIQENLGNVIVPLEEFGQKGITRFIKNQLASTVKEELEVLLLAAGQGPCPCENGDD